MERWIGFDTTQSLYVQTKNHFGSNDEQPCASFLWEITLQGTLCLWLYVWVVGTLLKTWHLFVVFLLLRTNTEFNPKSGFERDIYRQWGFVYLESSSNNLPIQEQKNTTLLIRWVTQ